MASIAFKLSSSSSHTDSLGNSLIFRVPASKLDSIGGFGYKLKFSKMNVKMVKTAAFKNAGRRKSVRTLFENDAFVEDSSSTAFPSEFMAQEFQATLNRLSKWVATAMFMVVLAWKYDVESLWAAMGSVMNFIVCVTLKRLLKQERPHSAMKSDPGMPSSHAQSFFYILIFFILSIMEKYGVNEFTFTITVIALACGSYLSWLRVLQHFHTRSQVIVGGAVGSVFSMLWFWSWHSFVFEAFISLWWVRAIIVIGAATYFFGFLLYLFYYCFTDKS